MSSSTKRRPEGSACPASFYNETEARNYDQNSRMQTIQTEIAERALEMLQLPEGKASYILDIGCGSGLSGDVLEENGHYWVGCDISSDMLQVASERESETGDLINHDMGLGLPFRPRSFDGVISVSALQWLCYSDSSEQDPRLRLNRFFSSLYSVMKKDARAILQFYPESPEQAVLISQSASKVGFSGGLVVDYPNSSKSKKMYLCLSFERTYKMPAAKSANDVEHTVQSVTRNASNDKQRRSSAKKSAKNKGKTKTWIVDRKEKYRKQGKDVKNDSKFTGRKRPVRF